MNKYGLDFKYFENIIEREFGQGLFNYRPDEFARVLLRMAKTASPDTMLESEFVSNKIKAEGVQMAIDELKKGGNGHPVIILVDLRDNLKVDGL